MSKWDVQSDIEWSSALANTAVQSGWTVRRQTARYFTAEKRIGDSLRQLGISMAQGKLTASRIEVIDTTDVTDQVMAWIEEES